MDMSFAIQALSAEWMATRRPEPVKGAMLHDVPSEIDRRVAQMKLAAWGVTIDTLTPAQHQYMYGL